jgi:hypothetical protein
MTLLTLKPERKLMPNPIQQGTCLKARNCPSVCRYCEFYQFQGRCGGYCHKLGVPVSSHWRSCPFALSPFAPSWEGGREAGL